MNIKHTPGPWIVREGDEWTNSIVTREGELPNGEPAYWEVASYNRRRSEAEANARLIAAAPELLSALLELLDSMDANGSCQYEMLRAAGRDVIAMVEGGAA